MAIPSTFIDTLTSSVDIVDLVGNYVTLKRAGRDFKANCPLPGHEEKTPSFYVSPGKQIFHCFGCGRGGSAIKFIQIMERLSFPDAVVNLAGRIGLDVPFERGSGPTGQSETLHEINKIAHEYFRQTLLSPAGKDGLAYLRGRGFSAKTIEAHKIGYATPSFDGLIQHLRSKNVDLAMAENLGLINRKQDGRGFFDFFRHRVVFPIIDEYDRVLGFSARVIDNSQPNVGKYINTRETPVFHKGRLVFGFSLARKPMIDAGEVIVVEGQTDVIALHQAGITNVVAPLGTALTKEQVRKLMRTVRDGKIFLCFDGDSAGRKSAAGKLDILIEENAQAFISIMPAGKDPADLASTSEGVREFRKVLEDSESILKTKWKFLSDENLMLDGAERLDDAGRINELLRLISLCADDIKSHSLIQEARSLTNLPEHRLEARLAEIRRKTRVRKPVDEPASAEEGAETDDVHLLTLHQRSKRRTSTGVTLKESSYEHELLSFLVSRPKLIINALKDHQIVPNLIQDPELREIYSKLLEIAADGNNISFACIEEKLAESALSGKLSQLVLASKDRGISEEHTYLKDVADTLKRNRSRELAEALNQTIHSDVANGDVTNEDKDRALRERLELRKQSKLRRGGSVTENNS
ncbi:MAG: DNA primase [Planctomycetes bacterium]|nr:DNA primase [Planctomycetota bacterium]